MEGSRHSPDRNTVVYELNGEFGKVELENAVNSIVTSLEEMGWREG